MWLIEDIIGLILKWYFQCSQCKFRTNGSVLNFRQLHNVSSHFLILFNTQYVMPKQDIFRFCERILYERKLKVIFFLETVISGAFGTLFVVFIATRH